MIKVECPQDIECSRTSRVPSSSDAAVSTDAALLSTSFGDTIGSNSVSGAARARGGPTQEEGSILLQQKKPLVEQVGVVLHS